MSGKPMFFGPNEAICPYCDGAGSPAHTITTTNRKCSYCLGKGKVRCLPNVRVLEPMEQIK